MKAPYRVPASLWQPLLPRTVWDSTLRPSRVAANLMICAKQMAALSLKQTEETTRNSRYKVASMQASNVYCLKACADRLLPKRGTVHELRALDNRFEKSPSAKNSDHRATRCIKDCRLLFASSQSSPHLPAPEFRKGMQHERKKTHIKRKALLLSSVWNSLNSIKIV